MTERIVIGADGCKYITTEPAPVQAQSEPVGKVIRNGVIKWAGKYPDVGTELYAAPVQQVGINGLTEAETNASASVSGLTAPVQQEQSND